MKKSLRKAVRSKNGRRKKLCRDTRQEVVAEVAMSRNPCSSTSIFCRQLLPWRRPGRRELLHSVNYSGGLLKGNLRLRSSCVGVSCLGTLASGSVSVSPMMLRDAGATVLVLGGAYSLVRTFDALTYRNLVDQKLSRKIVHILSGLLFESSWPLFSSSMEARFFAAIVPFLNFLRLLIYGTSLANDEGLVKSLTREGNPKELLRGPLYYVLVLLLSVLLFWRDSPVGIISLAMMSAGDGFADIMGRRFGSAKLPFNKHKSWAGSISMFLFGFLTSNGMLYYYSSLGFIHLDWTQVMAKVALVSITATLVESLPIDDVLDDNISVPFSSMLMALLVFNLPN